MHLIVEVSDVLSTDMNRDYSTSPFGWIPPDPMVGVGKETVVVFVNSLMSIYEKSTMERIYGPVDTVNVIPGLSGTDVGGSDPYPIWDPFHERIWTPLLLFPPGGFALGVCVSNGPSPRSASDFKCFTHFTGAVNIGDYPKISVDGTAVYVGVQEASFSTGAFIGRVYVWDAATLLNPATPVGPLAPVNIIDMPFTADNIFTNPNVHGRVQWPARFEGPKPSGHANQVIVVCANAEVQGGQVVGNTISLSHISSPLGAASVTRVDVPVPVHVFPAATERPAIQRAPYTENTFNNSLVGIEPGIALPHGSVVRNDMLYTAMTVLLNDRYVVRWYQIDVSQLISHNKARLVQYGTIDDGINDLIWPTLAVDGHGNIAFGFTRTGPYLYAQPMYTVRLASDPIGTVRFPLQPLAPGDHGYQAVAGGRNRYGDYSGLVSDPTADGTFWIFNQYTYRIPPNPRYAFGAAWNTKLGAFKLEKTGGRTVNAPQKNHVVAGTGDDHGPSVVVPAPSTRRTSRAPHKKAMTMQEAQDRHFSHHIPHGEGCHREGNRIVCPPMEGE